jgi:hypothetical protein
MNRRWRILGALLVGVATLSGCNSGRVKEKTVELHMTSGLERAKEYLQNYAKGEPIGSESALFGQLVEEVRKTDPTKADVLEKGFEDLQKSKSGLASKAQALLNKL